MARVIGRVGTPGALVVEVGACDVAATALRARVRVRVRDAGLAARLEAAIAQRLEQVLGATVGEPCPVVRVPPWGPLPAVRGAVAVLAVTRRGLADLEERIGGLERAGAVGVQLVWNGTRPPRDVVEPAVFAVLEQRRGRMGACPVVLAPTRTPVEALTRMIPTSGIEHLADLRTGRRLP